MIDTRFRTDAVEHMDNFGMSGEVMKDALEKIARINQWLGGNRLTENGVIALLKKAPKDKTITIRTSVLLFIESKFIVYFGM